AGRAARPSPDARRARAVRRAAALAVLAAACLHAPPAAPPLLLGTSGDYPPFSLAGDGTTEGLDIEVARRFARDSGRRLELVRFRWPELTRDLAAGRFDLAMGGVTLRPERAVAGVFTRPVAEAGAVVLAHQRLDPRTACLRLGVNAGGHLEPRAAPAGSAPSGRVRAPPSHRTWTRSWRSSTCGSPSCQQSPRPSGRPADPWRTRARRRASSARCAPGPPSGASTRRRSRPS